MRNYFLGLAVFALAACSTPFAESLDTRPNAGPCPPVGSLYDASRVVVLDGNGETFNNIEYTGEIVDVRLFCRYVGDNPVRAEVEVDFAFGKGPLGVENQHDYNYWIAITRRNGKVLNKETFTVRADFRDGPVTGASELVQRIVIPRADSSVSAANFEILVGFELTDEQFKFNKEGRRFLLNAGQ